MNFQIGEKIVYPNHGIGTVENISTRSFGSQLERFYLLRLTSSSMTVMVPFSHVTNVGLRRVTRNCEVAKVLNFLAEGVCHWKCDWKDRFKENTERMNSGSMLEVAEVMKTLVILQQRKPLSFREKKMLDRSRHMLITEISICRAVSEEEAGALIERSLSKCALPMPLPM